jgi:hypothetical protein
MTMTMNTAEQALRDEAVRPDAELIGAALGPAEGAYVAFMEAITAPPLGLAVEWRYYKDGKAWLCKITHKKMTVCWLSVWIGFFKVGFYFNAKTAPALEGLDLDPAVLSAFRSNAPIGRLLPLTFDLRGADQLGDLLKVTALKKTPTRDGA